MTQQEFHTLSQKYLEGQATPAEEAQLLAWHRAQPAPGPPGLSETQQQALEKRLWQALNEQIRPPVWFRPIRRLGWLSGVAACLALVLGTAYWFSARRAVSTTALHKPANNPRGIEIRNTTPTEQAVRLKDGTVVWLKQNSSVVYDRTFNQDRRTVYLKGEAFFEVKRDAARPFVVHAGDLVTEVLGTSFRIRPHPNTRKIEVIVRTGRVSVYAQKPNRRAEHNGVILTPNQRATFDVASQAIVPTLIEQPVPLPAAVASPPELVFQAASLHSVLATLTEVYGIEFVLVNPSVSTCQITADLTGLGLFTQLDLICKSIDATYEKRGTVVFITGDGC